jgi:pyruvate dehydrogenase E2 component (dihydrolipoamide acetyltransferase)
MRRLASNLGVSLDHVTGTGPGGRVQAADVQSAAAATEHPVTPTVLGSQQLTTVVEADVTSLLDQLRESPDHLSLTALLARAVVEALRSHPLLNSTLTDEGVITGQPAQHLGIGVDTDRGLVVPVLRDAGDLNVAALARRIDDLGSRARAGEVAPEECSGGTFTLIDIGSRGVLVDAPRVVPGQVGVLGVGSVMDRPVVVTTAVGERAIAIRSVVHLAMSYDDRFVDGAEAARFLHLVTDSLSTSSRSNHVSR